MAAMHRKREHRKREHGWIVLADPLLWAGLVAVLWPETGLLLFPFILVIGSLVVLLASWWVWQRKYRKLQDPNN
jgi:hypothetical protein